MSKEEKSVCSVLKKKRKRQDEKRSAEDLVALWVEQYDALLHKGLAGLDLDALERETTSSVCVFAFQTKESKFYVRLDTKEVSKIMFALGEQGFSPPVKNLCRVDSQDQDMAKVLDRVFPKFVERDDRFNTLIITEQVFGIEVFDAPHVAASILTEAQEIYCRDCQKLLDLGLCITDASGQGNALYDCKKKKLWFVDLDVYLFVSEKNVKNINIHIAVEFPIEQRDDLRARIHPSKCATYIAFYES